MPPRPSQFRQRHPKSDFYACWIAYQGVLFFAATSLDGCIYPGHRAGREAYVFVNSKAEWEHLNDIFLKFDASIPNWGERYLSMHTTRSAERAQHKKGEGALAYAKKGKGGREGAFVLLTLQARVSSNLLICAGLEG